LVAVVERPQRSEPRSPVNEFNGDITPTTKATNAPLVSDAVATEPDKPIEEHHKMRQQHNPTLAFPD
jgi:hypothetical protein